MMDEIAVSKIATHRQLTCDVFVGGGGISGVSAAVSAARNGAKVILCQNRSVLGGNNSSEIRMHMQGADFLGRRGKELSVEAREGGLVEEIRLEHAVRNPQKSWSMNDLILYEKCMAEPNLTLMLDSVVIGVDVEGGTIRRAYVSRSSTEEYFEISAKIFIDCTGDGRLAAEAGATIFRGREDKSTFSEPGAQDQADQKEMGMTLLFESSDMGKPMPFTPPTWARKFSDAELSKRDCTFFNYGYWWVEWGGDKDTIKDTPLIREKLLEILFGVWDYIKNSGKFDSENYALNWFGFVPGKRQSRRFEGRYVLTEKDLSGGVAFPDTIAYGGWPADVHPPEGIDAADAEPAKQDQTQHLYPIPLRCCVSSGFENLMFAGRNISASYIAFSSSRVMATCGVIGQGVGTAAALAVASQLSPAALTDDAERLVTLQSKLQADDAFLPGAGADSDDLAVSAVVSASSEQAEGAARFVQSPFTRAVDGEGGVHPDMLVPGSCRWMSDPAEGLPAWIELSWSAPVTFNQLRLVFDTGLHRPLTLTDDKGSGMLETMIWAAQPETVRDYEVHYHTDQEWKPVVSVKGNYQRLNVHRVDFVTTNRIKVRVEATHGLDHARICRIALYNQ